MFRLIRASTLMESRRRLQHTEYELAEATAILVAQSAGWEPPQALVDGDLAAVLAHVENAVREEAACRAADYAEQHLDPTHCLGLTLAERWSGYPDGSAVYCLGADRWLHYHPGRTLLRTYQSLGWPETEEIHLIKSSPRPWEMQTVASLPALLELLDLNRPHPRSTDSDRAVPAAF
ncbi:hypothetical protein Kpho02_59870 [Kitasatospora phosalacinea]|uniref:Uncharacterized protein n=1 Tax=Kitasatospora phosalacinea TaxID=2065 RepID=A0A9W6QEQ6_9ACTN|nr:hypothetical protein [Kitasatospora phosalacinea]GLW73689.1 hypothetical protein Kpho02_59870 [Kitasatospora phosalacinea]